MIPSERDIQVGNKNIDDYLQILGNRARGGNNASKNPKADLFWRVAAARAMSLP